MSGQRWITIVVAAVLVMGAFVAGIYIGGLDTAASIAQEPSQFFSEFEPEQHLEAITKLDWEVLTDGPVTGEHYGNPPHARAYARRTTRLVTTVTEEQWGNLSDGVLDVFLRLGDLIEENDGDPGGGNFRLWSLGKDSFDNSADAYYGFGHRYYGGKRGVGSHHGLLTCTIVKAGNEAEVLFFIRESWPRE